jgi:hypothetical protein
LEEIDAEVVDLIVKRVTEYLTTHFDARHDELKRRMAALERLVEASTIDIKHDTGFTRAIASRSFTDLLGAMPPPETPADDTPCPPAIGRAVNADPSGGDQRVDLDRYGVVAILRPGADADDAWDEVKTSARSERGAQ